MPRYAAIVSKYQRQGIAPRYGKSVVYWKSSLRERATCTPGDSWNLEHQGALMSFTSLNYPEVIFAHADEQLMRLAAAEATHQDQGFLKRVQREGMQTNAYIETQIHGDLTWNDVHRVAIGSEEEHVEDLVTSLENFRKKNGYTFEVHRT